MGWIPGLLLPPERLPLGDYSQGHVDLELVPTSVEVGVSEADV